MTTIAVPLSKLQVSPFNVRTNQEDAKSTEGLQASIAAHGLLMPLVVHPLGKPKGHYGVLAGGRRLHALNALQAAGKFEGDPPIDVVVRDISEADIGKASLAENLLRRDLRPYEIYAAFASAQKRGASVEEIAREFGQRRIWVEQVLRLGNLHPLIFKELAGGRLTEDRARAYAATEDNELQLAIFSRLTKGPVHNHHPREIRAAMKVNDQDAGRLLTFVGRSNYDAAGGRFERDLFEEAHEVGRVVDEELLQRLVNNKLDQIRDGVMAVVSRPVTFVEKAPLTGGQYGYIDLELKIDWRKAPPSDHHKGRKAILMARKAEIEEAARALLDENGQKIPGTDPAEAALDAEYDPICAELLSIENGRRIVLPKKGDIVAVLGIDRSGEPDLTFWFASRKAKREAEATQSAAPAIREGAAMDDSASPGTTAKANARVKDEHGLSQDSIQIIRSLRRTILRAMLVENVQGGGSVAQDYLIWSQLRSATYASDGTAGEIGAFGISGGMYDSTLDATIAQDHMRDTRAYTVWTDAIALLKEQSFITGQNLGGAFIDFTCAPAEIKNLAAAVVAGLSLKRSMNAEGYSIAVHDVLAQQTARSYPAAIRKLWTPTAAFLNMMPKAKRLDSVKPMIDAKTFGSWAKMKAGEVTDLALRVLTGRSPSLKAGGVSAAAEWVPPYLQFAEVNVLESAVPAAEAEDRAAA